MNYGRAEGAEVGEGASDASYLKAHRTAASLRVNTGSRGMIGWGRHEYKALCRYDASGRPQGFVKAARQTTNYTGAASRLDDLLTPDGCRMTVEDCKASLNLSA